MYYSFMSQPGARKADANICGFSYSLVGLVVAADAGLPLSFFLAELDHYGPVNKSNYSRASCSSPKDNPNLIILLYIISALLNNPSVG